MRPIIEFCAGNAHFGTDKALKPLEEHSDCEIIEYGCLTNCGQCYLAPFALVNDEMVEAPTAEELYAAVLRKIKELEQL
ncbi:YuzB family protein [Paenibacillus sp. DMB20]|uniref:YuzB family protein n=1 Tax=Paenibacillus sp. DMB20 TaxID=1642570 RepID=UPI000627FF57|nr:YuzB family protein [Paenibacillus sp. DMB20]KKO50920.1 UDP-N-acetylmuramoylalanine--D-glutamate ligase [Paenibacillus sp. DMB20]